MLATVKGDVHDIGKNLVDIILTNNGYEVHNLGIKCPIGDMVATAEAIKADAIGMSGLLVKSTLIMRDNLEELNSGGLAHYPVLLGGAALTRSYVERDLREVYEGTALLRTRRVRGAPHDGAPDGAEAHRRRRPGLRARADRPSAAGEARLGGRRCGTARSLDGRPRSSTDNEIPCRRSSGPVS